MLEWAALLGLVPERLLLAGQSLARANAEVAALEQRIAAFKQSGGGVALITQAALASGTFTVTIEPRLEGPGACRVRVGDLVRIRRADGALLTVDDVRRDALLGPALTAANGVRQAAEVWAVDARPERELHDDRRGEWVWLVPRLNVSRPKALLPVRLGVRSIAIVGTQLSSWGADVASLTARAVGYASTNTGVLSRTALGEQLSDEPLNETNTRRATVRAAIAADLLANTGESDLMVWSHASIGAHQDFIDTLQRAGTDTLIVLLRPTDALHDWLAGRPRDAIPTDQLDSSRHALDTAVAGLANPTLTLDVGYPSDFESTTSVSPGLRDAFLERSIILALRLLDELHRHYDGPSLEFLHEDTDPQLAQVAGTIAREPGTLWLDQSPLTSTRSFL